MALDNLPVTEAELAKAEQQESQRFQLASDLESLRAQQQNLDERLRLLSGLKVAGLLTQGFPNALRGTPLETQRQAYLNASLRVDQLAVSLGPKHPTLMAAQGAADEARAALSRALTQTLAETNQKKAALDAEAQRLGAGWLNWMAPVYRMRYANIRIRSGRLKRRVKPISKPCVRNGRHQPQCRGLRSSA